MGIPKATSAFNEIQNFPLFTSHPYDTYPCFPLCSFIIPWVPARSFFFFFEFRLGSLTLFLVLIYSRSTTSPLPNNVNGLFTHGLQAQEFKVTLSFCPPAFLARSPELFSNLVIRSGTFSLTGTEVSIHPGEKPLCTPPTDLRFFHAAPALP